MLITVGLVIFAFSIVILMNTANVIAFRYSNHKNKNK
jgi:hypothetical protein